MSERRGTKALELWCKRVTEGYPNVKIENMTTSWRNGLAFCAIIHHFKPDLIDFDKLNKEDIYYNNDLAFRTAERHLGIPALLDADDMASHEVPDRLSILTYLAQFYQVFGAQDSSNRNNIRKPNNVEKTSVAKLAESPPKMAHVVSVPKREPCQKCSLPVFLAERLTVGKKIYHRTCLKCARCKSQLTLGSFYETEIDDEYCCETCPDEEKSLLNDKGVNNKNNFKLNENNCGNKIAERLAFFENRSNNDSKRLLQKSLSDEEKSQSLKKFEENQTNFLQLNATLNNNFSNSNYSLATTTTTTTKSSLTTSSSEDTEDDSLQIKDLNLELSLKNQQQQFNKNLDLLHESSKKLELLSNKQKEITNNEEDEDEDNAWNTTTIAPSKLKTNNEEANNDEQINKEQNIFTNLRNTENITHNIKNNTKDCTDNHDNDDADNNEKINISSIVRARLEHFQTTKKTIENSNNINNKINSINDNEFMEQQNLMSINNDDEGDIKNNYEKNKVPESNDNDQILQLQQEDKNLTNSSNENNVSYFDTDENFIKIEEENKEEEEEEEKQNEQNEASNLNEEISTETNESHKIELSEENEQNEINHPITSSSNIDLSLKINDDDKEEKNITVNDKDDVDSSFKNKSSLTLRKIPLSNEFKNSQNITKRSTIAAFGRNTKLNEYPEELNPFASDEDDENHKFNGSAKKEKRKSLNPFDSDDSENDVTDKNLNSTKLSPKQPSTPKVSTNPFGSETEDEDETNQSLSSCNSTSIKRTPVPTPRHYVSKSQNPTPEVTPRKIRQSYDGTPFKFNTDYHNNSATLSNSINSNLKTNYEDNFRGSTQSLSIHGSGSETRRKIKKAPAPPPPTVLKRTKELFPTSESDSKKSSPSSSNAPSPKFRKKRIAPAPPVKNDLPSLTSSQQSEETSIKSCEQSQDSEITIKLPTLNVNIPEIQKLSDEEKAFLENSATFIDVQSSTKIESSDSSILTNTSDGSSIETIPKMRLIAFDASILEDSSSSQDFKLKEDEEENVVYRRKIMPPSIDTPTREGNSTNSFVDADKSLTEESHDRQLEKLKDNKEAKNRNRQSQVSIGTEDGDHLLNKSIQGKWKRRKGPAPALPVPPRRVLQMLPLQEIRHELEVIEVQQQGLEKQGVMLEKMIRDRCEGQNSGNDNNPNVNSKEVEDLILQLFELVNEKNELFRRQAELMYLRRQHRLEQEQADLEYEIRVLMAQPECNKTDSDKSREESLIARLVEVVQLRNEVIECLEMDRVREAEEDKSIKQRLEMHTAKRDEELSKQTPTKLSKKEKKKQKELKKLVKCKKLDDDKDADESEINLEKQKLRKKKKKFLF